MKNWLQILLRDIARPICNVWKTSVTIEANVVSISKVEISFSRELAPLVIIKNINNLIK